MLIGCGFELAQPLRCEAFHVRHEEEEVVVGRGILRSGFCEGARLFHTSQKSPIPTLPSRHFGADRFLILSGFI